jgi:AcrR family transcriptional regulator
MYRHCTTEDSARRQRQLEQCFLNLLQQTPYDQISISQICDCAALSRKSFYRYFSSKEGCLCALLDHTIMDGASFYLPAESAKHQSKIIFERFFEYWQQMAPLLDVLRRDNLEIRLVERMMFYVTEEENQFRSYLGAHSGDSFEYMTYMISGIMGLVISWHHSGYPKSAHQMADILERLLKN